ncbi:MAG TPA: hypothetical protein VIE46_00160, partial [Gemmatimonadales bacterium]
MPAARCAGSRVDSIPSPAILALADSTRKRLGVEADPDALHVAAIIDLLWAGSEGIPLERSVSYLRTASRLTDHPAAVLTDLAAALLVRAERHQTGRDLLEAIDAASGAVALEPTNEGARFNLALGLERLGLDGQAQRAWRAVLQVDSTSRWAEEAKDRPLAPAEVREFPAPPALTAPDSEVAAYAEAAPEAAMLLGWDHVLDSWSAAVIGGDAHGADRLLHSATVIGRELERRGRDATLADGVRAVRALADRPSATLALARAHHEYAVGRLAYRAGDYDAAERSFVQVLRAAGYSAALRRWAQLHRALAQAYQGHLDAALAGLRPVVANADPTRYPSLVGRAHWARGTIALRRGRYEEAIRALESAAVLFERTGERENLGTVQYLAADARHYLADPAAEYAAIQRALATLRPFRHSVWLHNLLLVAARFAAADGLPRAAAHLQDEGVEVAERVGDSIHVAEAHIARARLRVAAGMNQAASEDVVAAEGIVRALEPGPRKDWFLADLQLAEAVTSLAGQPSLAVAALDSSARFWASQHNQIRLMPVLVTRAETELASGNAAAATADLDRALALLNEQSTSVASMTLRASLLDAAQHVVDRLVMLRVRSGRPAEALADLERVRISLASTHRRPGEPAREPPAPAREQVTAEYALVGDTLLIWTIVGGTVQLARSTVDRALLVRAIERVRAALELRADEAALLPDLAALYDWLLRPIEP